MDSPELGDDSDLSDVTRHNTSTICMYLDTELSNVKYVQFLICNHINSGTLPRIASSSFDMVLILQVLAVHHFRVVYSSLCSQWFFITFIITQRPFQGEFRFPWCAIHGFNKRILACIS
jgi:hypothetical protein